MGLIDSVRSFITPIQKPADVKSVIDLCHTFALAYLRMKASSGKLYLFHGEKLEDLAWDFIADLFEKDDDGRFRVFYNYFDEHVLSETDENELQFQLRRLVFTTVEDNIFKVNGENDPSLKKIIRNLKLALRDQSCKHTVCYRNGEIVIDVEEGTNLPQMPSEFMQMKLCSRLQEYMQIPDILIEVIDILNEQDVYKKRFPLVALAMIIREVFVHFHEDQQPEQGKPAAENLLLSDEFERFLEKSVKEVRFKVGYNYVRKNKINLNLLKAYTNASRNIVRDHFLQTHDDLSHFESLKQEITGLDYEEYRSCHRPLLQYMVKLIRADVVRVYRNEWI